MFDLDYASIESQFIIFSDGYLVLENDWLEEKIEILIFNKEVFAVASDLKLENLPNCGSLGSWVPKAKLRRFKNYVVWILVVGE